MIKNNDNNFKLLKMKEKLLDIPNRDNSQDLLDYTRIAIDIDNSVYQELIEKIKRYEHNQPLEEEFKYLEEIEESYDKLNELQHLFKCNYSKYSQEELDLSDMSLIDIDGIRERKNVISGYLLSKENVLSAKRKISDLNERLIDETNRMKSMEQLISKKENELLNSFVNAEGRIKNDDGSISYTSIELEFKDAGFDLRKLLNNHDLLEEELSKMLSLVREKNEMLKTTEICYNSVPNKDNRDILLAVRKDTTISKYHLVLLKILKLLVNITNDCNVARQKRENILDLLEYRCKYLKEFNKHFAIDPFSRIKISEQLSFISSLEDNHKTINHIRREIVSTDKYLEELLVNNDSLENRLDFEGEFLKDNTSISSIDISDVSDSSVLSSPKDNQVVYVTSIGPKFLLNRAKEKTNGVIKRVSEMLKDDIPKVEIVSPELFIDSGEVFSQDKEVLDNFSLEVNEDSQDIKRKENDDLFEELSPFEDTFLFEDRYDNGMQQPINNNETLTSSSLADIRKSSGEDIQYVMPDIFWETKEDDVSVDNNFDEQINALLSSDNSVKTKKLI